MKKNKIENYEKQLEKENRKMNNLLSKLKTFDLTITLSNKDLIKFNKLNDSLTTVEDNIVTIYQNLEKFLFTTRG